MEDLPFTDLKSRQRAAWSSGDYAAIGVTLQIVGESLCEAMDLPAGARVLDVAAGNGNATLAAARRGAVVTSTDFVPQLLERGRDRARAENLEIRFRQADAEALPFPDGDFDAILSTFGVMFTPNQRRAADEMLRVCRPGGRIGLACWTPQGFIGQVLKIVGGHMPPPPPGVVPASRWGTKAGINQLFSPAHARVDSCETRQFVFRYRSVGEWLGVFRAFYGPMLKAFEALPEDGQAALAADLTALAEGMNRAGAGTMAVPGEYIQVVIARR